VSPIWTGAMTGSHTNVIVCLDTIWHQSFSGMARTIKAKASVARLRLIPMGVWCDADRNQCSEKTGAIRMLSDGARREGFMEGDGMKRYTEIFARLTLAG
jgi:hypothetical protein